jgi:hypothetical protein
MYKPKGRIERKGRQQQMIKDIYIYIYINNPGLIRSA